MYIVYRITNDLNPSYYIGCRKLRSPDEPYMGSGREIKAAIKEHGVEHFQRETLFAFPDAEPALAKEEELIRVALADPLCMNLRKGGIGGFDWINRTLPHPGAKITEDDVREIRRLAVEENLYAKDLADKFGICTKRICAILRGQAWQRVTGGLPVVEAHQHVPKRGKGSYGTAHAEKVSIAKKQLYAEHPERKQEFGARMREYWRNHTAPRTYTLKSPRLVGPTRGMKWIHLDAVQRLVDKSKLPNLFSVGWELGRVEE
jgi:hypothetical protein